MIYSCFDPPLGLYKYFRDDKTQPINSDLPVPKLKSETQAGYPALDAARPLPSGAKPFGQGWHARGIVVRCAGSSALSSFSGLPSSLTEDGPVRTGALAAAGVAIGVIIHKLLQPYLEKP